MNRRKAIQSLVVATGAILILPSCLRQEEGASILLNNLNICSDQEKTLTRIVETIIPGGDTPGGRELHLHLFVLKMIDDCHDQQDQQHFMKGLSLFNDAAQQHLGKSFQACSKERKEAFLVSLSADEGIAEALVSFYRMTKQRTIQGYLNSKYVMTNLLKYELVPGRYEGYMPA